MKKNAILDTNIFLHYDIQSVDWLTELSATEAEIIVCPTVIEELDRKKEDAKKGLADRARRNLHLIESLDGVPNGVRNNVRLTVLGTEPQVEWHLLRLDPNLPDDRILASMMERNNDNDFFISGDTTPRIKAKKRDLKWVILQSQRLEDPKSEEEEKIRELEAKLQSYGNRIPRLSLMLEPGVENAEGRAIFFIKKSAELPESKVRRLINEKKKQLGLEDSTITHLSSVDNILNRPAYLRHNTYLSRYEKYLKQKNIFEQERARTIEMEFFISCEGNIPAENVRCEIEFPEGIEILEESDVPFPPEEPNDNSSTTRRVVLPHNLLETPESNLEILINLNKVQARLRHLQHGSGYLLDKLFVRLPAQDTFKNFNITYLIHADNLPKPVMHTIPVIFKNA